MKLKFVAICILLSVASINFAGPVKMPSAQVLNERLGEKGFQHFAEKTKIADNLADRELEALGVAITVETSLYDYNENLKKGGLSEQQLRKNQMIMKMTKPMLFKALLQDSPEALDELKQLGLIE